jgi:hypothetical protein
MTDKKNVMCHIAMCHTGYAPSQMHVPLSIKSSIVEKKPKEFAFDQDFVCGHTPNPPLFWKHKGARRQPLMPLSVY